MSQRAVLLDDAHRAELEDFEGPPAQPAAPLAEDHRSRRFQPDQQANEKQQGQESDDAENGRDHVEGALDPTGRCGRRAFLEGGGLFDFEHRRQVETRLCTLLQCPRMRQHFTCAPGAPNVRRQSHNQRAIETITWDR